jgi:RNA polymerase sigma-70 factor (ECF subfamily)
VLILRDVLDWSAAEAATLLDTSVAAANSALQRARATLREQLPERPADRSASEDLSADERALLQGFIETHERGDAAAAAALLRDDVRVTMPPHPLSYDGIDAILPLMRQAFGPPTMGDWRLVPTRANRQPAAASYLRRPGDSVYRAFKLDVLRVEDGTIAEITTFGSDLFATFGLDETL